MYFDVMITEGKSFYLKRLCYFYDLSLAENRILEKNLKFLKIKWLNLRTNLFLLQLNHKWASKEFNKCRFDNLSMGFILFYANLSICENK